MSQQVTRILISVLMLALACFVYVAVFTTVGELADWRHIGWVFALAGMVSWIFLRMSWYLLWRRYISNKQRRRQCMAVTFGTVVITVSIIGVMSLSDNTREVGAFLGSTVPPLLGQVAIMLVYQETPAERADRLSGSKQTEIVCPACGYNLAGLTSAQCPECGKQYTLDALVAAQPGRGLVEM